MTYFVLCLLGFILGCIVSNILYRVKLASVYTLEKENDELKKKLSSSKDIIKMLLHKRKQNHQ